MTQEMLTQAFRNALLPFQNKNATVFGAQVLNVNSVYPIDPAPIIDEASTTVTYIGYAPIGTATSAASWLIARVTKASATSPNGVVITEYADGNMAYDNIWNNRAALSYSR